MASYYCPDCLYKPKGKITSATCHCGSEMRKVSNSKRRAQVVTRLRNMRSGKPASTRSRYKEYLDSPIWKEIRSRVMKRDMSVCQCCHTKAEVVHHRDYKASTLSGETINSLIALCRPCHKAIHRDRNGKRHGIRATESSLVEKLSRLPEIKLKEPSDFSPKQRIRRDSEK